MGKGKRNKLLRNEEVATQKNQGKKQFVMPKWAKIAICAVLLLAIVGGIAAAAIINSGIIYRSRVIIESESGKFDLNQQMAAFILWQTVYQQAYYEYYYLSWGIYQDTDKVLENYYSANDYAVITATSYTTTYLKTGINSMQDYLSKMVASADAAVAAGLKLESHDKEEAKAYVEQLQTYYLQFKNEFAQIYSENSGKIPNTGVWALRYQLAVSSFQDFLGLSVGDTFKSSDIEDAAKLMIMYSKYSDYLSLDLEDDATADMLQDFILRHPEGHFETKYYTFNGAEEAMIRNFFSDKFMDEHYKTAVAKYVASLDLNKNMTDDEKTAQLEALGMNNFTTYTKTVDADGNATYSDNLNEKIGEAVFNTSIKANQISAIADGDKVYLVYFSKDSTTTTATLSYKEYTYDACVSRLPEIENLQDLIAECIKAGENTTDYETDNNMAADLLAQLNDNKEMAMPEGATVVNTTKPLDKDDTNKAPKSILDVLYGKDASVKEGWNFAVNDPTVSYVVKVTAIEKDEEGNNTTNYTISYVEFKDDAFVTLLNTVEEEFTLYLLDTKTDAPTYSMDFDTFEQKVVNWLLDENYNELVLSHYANEDLKGLLDSNNKVVTDNLNTLFGENGVKCIVKNYATEKALDSAVYNYIFNSKNLDSASVVVGKDDKVFLVYVAPKDTTETAHEGCTHAKDATTVKAAVKEYNIADYEAELIITKGEETSATTTTFRDQIFKDLTATDRKNTTSFKSSEDLAKVELDAFTAGTKAWPTDLTTVKTYKPAKTSDTTVKNLNTAPQAIIDKIYPNGTSTTSVSSVKAGSYYQVDDNGTSYVVKVLSVGTDTNLTCEIQYQSFTDENAYCGYFRTIKNKLNTAMSEKESTLTYPDSITDGSYQAWFFEGEYKEATADAAATHAFERKENDLTFIATTDSNNKVTGLTVYIVKEVAKQVKTETPVVYGGYLAFSTEKEANKAYKQLKDKTNFELLDKFVSIKSTSKDADGEETVATPTIDFALTESSVSETAVKNWLFGDRQKNDLAVVAGTDGKYYLVVYMSKEQTWLRTARTDWIDAEITSHLDNLVKDGRYAFNADVMAKIEDVATQN